MAVAAVADPKRAELKRRAAKVVRHLAHDYPDAHCALDFKTPLELLVATILSAQCTDKRVNMVVPGLFAKYKTAVDFARAPLPALEKAIQSTGFFRNKAKNIKGCCRAIMEQHEGQVPRSMEALVALPGIGRKTANVVLGTAFGIPSGVVVDTHVGRVSRRLGLVASTDAVKAEQELCALLPKKEWIAFSHRMIWHGRAICEARQPKCEACSMNTFCPRIGVATKGKHGS